MFNVSQLSLTELVDKDEQLKEKVFPDDIMIAGRINYHKDEMFLHTNDLVTPHGYHTMDDWGDLESARDGSPNESPYYCSTIYHPLDYQKVAKIVRDVRKGERERWDFEARLHVDCPDREWIKIRDKGDVAIVDGDRVASWQARAVEGRPCEGTSNKNNSINDIRRSRLQVADHRLDGDVLELEISAPHRDSSRK